ncbi:Zinc resistance conferring protein [Malassezia pachydermatis]|uniref:Zinc cadmium resistance protein n=1 Tax=Malassezia pachydermatis TaxID=77020 RepID=A0A0M8MLB9_9BASI|nr:zinc cadmium resistance protein [Malassezia pachydermatis]KOS14806.1 zinc cadmium resistance protein [Malassezia pachydermatis]
MGGLSNEAKIIILLCIDIVFFFIELISGYSVGSLALVADSFHMLNDIMSLVVALYAVRLLNKKDKNPSFSYGWQRAEILGALFNGVFLLALCFSIFMEALERLLSKPKVTNPALVMIVGSFGLLSNIIGLLLFQGHAHPGHSHDHEHGHGHEHAHDHDHDHDLERGEGHTHEHSHEEDEEETNFASNVGDMIGHPANTRASVMNKAQSLGYDKKPKSTGEQQSLLSPEAASTSYGTVPRRRLSNAEQATAAEVRRHRMSMGAAGHSHGNMNMRGVFLHVLGDAIGNIGVIMTGALILYTTYSWRQYADPIISFIIACIIFNSALPLVKSASFILLQGVPTSVSLDGVRNSLLHINGVISLHDLHVWQLNENKIVASVHILVDCSGEESSRYMQIANQVRRSLHLWGIHSSTIQPEFVPGGLKEAARLSGVEVDEQNDSREPLRTPDGNLVKAELAERTPACLLACDANECGDNTCCEIAPPQKDSSAPATSTK